jgi:CheY-like chemotaxis protein
VAGLQAFGSASARGDPFDVVITDLGMPRMDGREVARAVKEVSASTPVILLTGWGGSGGAGSETGARFDAILAKPPRLDHLRVALSRAIRTVPAPAS